MSLGKINKNKDLKAIIEIDNNLGISSVHSDDTELINYLNETLPDSIKSDKEHLHVETHTRDTKQQVYAQTSSYYNSKGEKPEINIQFKGLRVVIGIIATLAVIGIFLFA